MSVGEWVSIYVDGGTVTTYVAQVTALHAAGLGVVLSSTAKYGTKPSASATARSAKVGGSWATEQVLAAGGLATTTVPASTKINIKASLTITASRTISMAGTTTAPLWFSGYNTTPGDLDADTTNALAKPVWALNSTFLLTTSGSFQTWTSLSLTGSRDGTIWTASGTSITVTRCRSSNTNAGTTAVAFAFSDSGTVSYSWFKTPATATSTGSMTITASGTVIGCICEGHGQSCFYVTNGSTLVKCIAINGVRGLQSDANTVRIFDLTVYNMTSDGIKFTAAAQQHSCIVGSLFSNCGGYGINNGSGANIGTVYRANNDFYSCSSGNENGFGDSPAFFGQTESSSPVTSSTDMTPVVGANARNNGFPGIFENQSYSSYPDIGAVRHVDPSGGGGPVGQQVGMG